MFTPRQESLLLLNGLKNQIVSVLRAFTLGVQKKDENIKFTTGNRILILVCSFLKEWNKFASSENNEEIITTLKITSPCFARIRRWKGLPSVRNKLIAHNHRNGQGKVNWSWDVFAKYDCPTNYAEKVLLGECVVRAVNIALKRHQNEYKQGEQKCLQKNRHIEEKGICTITEIHEELRKIDAEVSRIKKEIS